MSLIRLVATILLAALCLTGCIDSEVGINYVSQTQGEIVQHIRLGDRLDLDADTSRQWLQTIEQRSRQLGGRTQHLAERELIVTIPFNNGKDLAAKFNAFFNPLEDSPTEEIASDAAIATSSSAPPKLPNVKSRLQVTERNLVVVERNRLELDVDLQSLGLRSPKGKLLIQPGSLLDLEFQLNTPWGARVVDADGQAVTEPAEPKLTWTLQPGELNHIEAVFWIPSPLGIGTVAIIILTTLGATLRAALFKAPKGQAL